MPGEAAAAHRHQAAKPKKAAPTPQQPKKQNTKPTAPKGSGFNLVTYKIHALGDYADHIERFGPTDCFSTQQVRSQSTIDLLTLTLGYPLTRVSLSTAGSKGSTSEPTRCGFSARLQNTNGLNVTIGSTLTR